MNAHPLHSIVLERYCDVCQNKKGKLDGTMLRLKLMMKEINDSVERLKTEEDIDKE